MMRVMDERPIANYHDAAEGGKFACPHCGSTNVRYAEDSTADHEILGIDGKMVLLDPDGDTHDLTFNERLICQECLEESALPEWVELEYKFLE